jgi:hypothetical protein
LKLFRCRTLRLSGSRRLGVGSVLGVRGVLGIGFIVAVVGFGGGHGWFPRQDSYRWLNRYRRRESGIGLNRHGYGNACGRRARTSR